MAYLVDSNSLFDAKNLYYRFEFCPGFWDWLILLNRQGIVYSVDAVKEECRAGRDRLTSWVVEQGDSFFLVPDADVIESHKQICAWVMQQKRFELHIRTRFIAKADPFLIAHGLVHGHTIVTQEDKNPDALKIPAVCRHFGMPESITLYQLPRIVGGLKLALVHEAEENEEDTDNDSETEFEENDE